MTQSDTEHPQGSHCAQPPLPVHAEQDGWRVLLDALPLGLPARDAVDGGAEPSGCFMRRRSRPTPSLGPTRQERHHLPCGSPEESESEYGAGRQDRVHGGYQHEDGGRQESPPVDAGLATEVATDLLTRQAACQVVSEREEQEDGSAQHDRSATQVEWPAARDAHAAMMLEFAAPRLRTTVPTAQISDRYGTCRRARGKRSGAS